MTRRTSNAQIWDRWGGGSRFVGLRRWAHPFFQADRGNWLRYGSGVDG